MLQADKNGKKVFLWGFMGSGKSYSGRHLAEALQWPFIDLDKEIELAENRVISEIFSMQGEDYFRKVESRTLLQIIDTPGDMVIATGGGTPCQPGNADIMGDCGLTIYLKRSRAELLPRLLSGKHKRPLLSQLSDEEIGQYIETKIQERRPYYEQAHCTIQGFFSEELIELLQDVVIHHSFRAGVSHPAKDLG